MSAARDAFVRTGYAGTSIDDLLRATGLQRASLYSAFGSKRGLFDAALRRPVFDVSEVLDLLLVALMDLAPDDADVRETAMGILDRIEDAPGILGRRILHRAGLPAALEEGKNR